MAYSQTNLLLDALPAHEKSEILKELEPVSMPVRYVLFEAETPPRYAHFVTSGIASVVTTLSGGDAVEVGLVGREGLAEKTHLLGPQLGMTRCFMQVGGTGLRMNFKRLQQRFLESPSLQTAIHRLIQYEVLSLAQLSACNRLHEVEERLARWLLMCADRLGEPEIRLTQEFMAQMLGARRSTVNIAAGTLQRAGVIDYKRSYIRIENRERMEDVACECYQIVKKLSGDMYKKLPEAELVDGQANGSAARNPARGAVRRASEE
jgi:CRP-like cAMP-binding protein